jgi:hypothetical protein
MKISPEHGVRIDKIYIFAASIVNRLTIHDNINQ